MGCLPDCIPRMASRVAPSTAELMFRWPDSSGPRWAGFDHCADAPVYCVTIEGVPKRSDTAHAAHLMFLSARGAVRPTTRVPVPSERRHRRPQGRPAFPVRSPGQSDRRAGLSPSQPAVEFSHRHERRGPRFGLVEHKHNIIAGEFFTIVADHGHAPFEINGRPVGKHSRQTISACGGSAGILLASARVDLTSA